MRCNSSRSVFHSCLNFQVNCYHISAVVVLVTCASLNSVLVVAGLHFFGCLLMEFRITCEVWSTTSSVSCRLVLYSLAVACLVLSSAFGKSWRSLPEFLISVTLSLFLLRTFQVHLMYIFICFFL